MEVLMEERSAQQTKQLEPGKSSVGTIEYSLDQDSWSSEVPTGTNAGEYTVYYRVVVANYDTVEDSVTVTIKQAANTCNNLEDLIKLPGVGRKTANVVLNVLFNKPTMPVDTHLLRISPKIGLAQGSTPLEIEKSLCARIPQEYMNHAHHWLILHGRYVCKSQNPKWEDCKLKNYCKFFHYKHFHFLSQTNDFYSFYSHPKISYQIQ